MFSVFPNWHANSYGQLLEQVLNFGRRLSTVNDTFEQNINLGYDLVFALITGPYLLRKLFINVLIKFR